MLLLHCCADAHCRLDAGGETQPLHRRGTATPLAEQHELKQRGLDGNWPSVCKGESVPKVSFLTSLSHLQLFFCCCSCSRVDHILPFTSSHACKVCPSNTERGAILPSVGLLLSAS